MSNVIYTGVKPEEQRNEFIGERRRCGKCRSLIEITEDTKLSYDFDPFGVYDRRARRMSCPVCNAHMIVQDEHAALERHLEGQIDAVRSMANNAHRKHGELIKWVVLLYVLVLGVIAYIGYYDFYL
jgi:hypothetical protein